MSVVNESDDAGALVRQFIDEAWNARRAAAGLVSPDYRTHMLQPDTLDNTGEVGPAYVEKDVAGWTSAFPDLLWHVDEVVAQGSSVAVRGRLRGTHRGPFLGVEPTGSAVEVNAMYVAHVAGGRITAGWLLLDRLGLLQQLGVLGDTRTILEESERRG